MEPHLDGSPRLLDDLDGVQVGGALEAQHRIHRQLSKVALLCGRAGAQGSRE